MSDFPLTFGDIAYLKQDTRDYIVSACKIKDKPTQKLSFLQILSKLDSYEAALVLFTNGWRYSAFCIIESFVNFGPDDLYCDVGSGFDCYLPFNERRDYLIKQWMKDEQGQKQIER
jgi:hypothetical protein